MYSYLILKFPFHALFAKLRKATVKWTEVLFFCQGPERFWGPLSTPIISWVPLTLDKTTEAWRWLHVSIHSAGDYTCPYILQVITRVHVFCRWLHVSIHTAGDYTCPYILQVITRVNTFFCWLHVSIHSAGDYTCPYILQVITRVHTFCSLAVMPPWIIINWEQRQEKPRKRPRNTSW